MIHTLTPNPAIDRLLMVPEFKIGDHVQVVRAAATPAGKGINIARYLRSLDVLATAWALVGRREISWFREVLRGQGLGAGIFPTRGFTRQNLTIVQQKGRETHFREPGPEVSAVEWAAIAGPLASHMEDGDTLVVAGSVPKGITAAMLLDATVPLTRRCSVVADINGPVAAGYFGRANGVWIKGNAEEIGEMSGRKPSRKTLAETMEEHPHIPGIIVTAGSGEVLAAVRTDGGGVEVVKARPPKVKKAMSSVGAGDAFSAGLCMAGLAPGDPDAMERALRTATATACAALLEPTVGNVDKSEVEKMSGMVKTGKA
ncbi:MAG: hypothetical protein JW909_03735 [Planctomycetes bacterium]|nr:hypothetical protein [Planctomycetota bacterium]